MVALMLLVAQCEMGGSWANEARENMHSNKNRNPFFIPYDFCCCQSCYRYKGTNNFGYVELFPKKDGKPKNQLPIFIQLNQIIMKKSTYSCSFRFKRFYSVSTIQKYELEKFCQAFFSIIFRHRG